MSLSSKEKQRILDELDNMNRWERQQKLASWENFLSWVKRIAKVVKYIVDIANVALEVWNMFH